MKKYIVTLCFIAIGVFAIAKVNTILGADAIVGKWLTQDKDGHIEIYKVGNKYFGKLVWMNEPYEADGKTLKKDKNNPDAKLKSRTLQNMVLISDFVYDSDNEWEDGTIYDPTSGKTYSCNMELQDDGKLEVTGYIGLSFIGKTVVWTKVN